MALKSAFPCNTCDLVFQTSQNQRSHMREPWHVYNLKRRMASLPSISADTYAESVATSLVSNKHQSPKTAVATPLSEDEGTEESDEIEDLSDEQAQINCCLFCTKHTDSLQTNLEHMSSDHSLYIPEIEYLSSLETMIEYLHTVISQYNECLYCGITKHSAPGIRRHMLDKRHCMINLEREPELLEFWEFSDSSGHNTSDEEVPEPEARMTDATTVKDLSQGEYTLPSGKVVGSKSKAREARLSARRTTATAKETSTQMVTKEPANNNMRSSAHPSETPLGIQGGLQDRTIAKRDAAGLIGVSDQRMRNLVTIQKKSQRQQAIVRASVGWADEKGGTHQKHYKQKMNLRDG